MNNYTKPSDIIRAIFISIISIAVVWYVFIWLERQSPDYYYGPSEVEWNELTLLQREHRITDCVRVPDPSLYCNEYKEVYIFEY